MRNPEPSDRGAPTFMAGGGSLAATGRAMAAASNREAAVLIDPEPKSVLSSFRSEVTLDSSVEGPWWDRGPWSRPTMADGNSFETSYTLLSMYCAGHPDEILNTLEAGGALVL